jgi:hypothetical protein
MVKVLLGTRVAVGAIAGGRQRSDGGSAGPDRDVHGLGGHHRCDASPMAGPRRRCRGGCRVGDRPIIGGQLAAPQYYEPFPGFLDDYPPRYGGPVGYGSADWEAYYFSRYRSFDPISGTYRGRDGRRHYCQ